MLDSVDQSQRLLAQLRFPCGDVPEPGDIKNVAPGIWWLRMPLPFQLNHINLWLVEEKDGWTIVDTGINTQATRELWDKIFAEKLGGKPVKRVIVTHLHPDHVGLAGWLCETFNTELWMSRGDYFMCRTLAADTGRKAPSEGIVFYHAVGLEPAQLAAYRETFGKFGKFISPMPESYRR